MHFLFSYGLLFQRGFLGRFCAIRHLFLLRRNLLLGLQLLFGYNKRLVGRSKRFIGENQIFSGSNCIFDSANFFRR